MHRLIDRARHARKNRVAFATLVLATLGLSLAVPPATATDGVGTMVVSTPAALSGSSGHVLTFTYTAGPGVLNEGELYLQIPAGWSEPSTTLTAAGYTTSSCGTVGVALNAAIVVTKVNLAAEKQCTIVYGSMAGKGPGASSPATPGTSTFTAQEESTPSGSPTALAESPQVHLYSPMITVTPTLVGVLTPGITLSFTIDGVVMNGGEIVITPPAGWPEPSTAATAPGYVTSTCGEVAIAGPKIQVTEVTLASTEQSCAIEYGSKGAGGPGATSPTESTTTTLETFTTELKLTPSPSEALQRLAEAAPPKVRVSSRELTILISGKGTVTGGGISCSEEQCKHRYTFGSVVTLSAEPAAGYTFLSWGGESCSGTGTCNLTLNGERKEVTIVANFTSHNGTTTGGGTTGTTAAATTGATTTGAATTGTTGAATTGAATTTGTTSATGTAGAATTTSSTTTSGTAVQPSVPTCSLKAPSSKLAISKKHGHATASITLIAECNQTVNVELQGEVNEKRPKDHAKVVELHRLYGSLTAGTSQKMALKVPASALSAFKHHAKESAKFTLTATNTQQTSDRVLTQISALRR